MRAWRLAAGFVNGQYATPASGGGAQSLVLSSAAAGSPNSYEITNGGRTFTVTSSGSGQGWWFAASDSLRSAGTGKWYFEVLVKQLGDDPNGTAIGVASSSTSTGFGDVAGANGRIGYHASGNKRGSSQYQSYGAAYSAGDVIGIGYDSDLGKLYGWKNGVAQGEMFNVPDYVTGAIRPYLCQYYASSLEVPTTVQYLPDGYSVWPAAPVAVNDPYFANVKSLLHMDTFASGGTPDSGGAKLSAVAVGDVSQSLDVKKMGTAAALFQGGGYLSTQQAPIDQIAFTLEFWLKFDPATSGAGKYFMATHISPYIWFYVSATGRISAYVLGSAQEIDFTFDDQWHAITLTRDASGLCHIFVDGVAYPFGVTSTATMSSNAVWLIGAAPGVAGQNAWMNCYIDEFRLTVGVNRYPGNSYTLATAPFPDQ